jgi:hypothetical protein
MDAWVTLALIAAYRAKFSQPLPLLSNPFHPQGDSHGRRPENYPRPTEKADGGR